MTAADDQALAARFYQARGDRAVIDAVMSQHVSWDITPGFPHSGRYEGLNTVLTTFLAPLSRLFDSIAATPETFYADGGGHVTVLGHYDVTGHTGEHVNCRFAHIWTITDGQLSHLHQTADTGVLQPLLQNPTP